LIFKASGVFNFAQGAMVLVCRVGDGAFWRVDSDAHPASTDFVGQPTCCRSCAAAVVMFIVAWVVELLVLRHLVEPRGRHFVDGDLGHYLLFGRRGPIDFWQRHLQDRCGHAQRTFDGLSSPPSTAASSINQEDLVAAVIARGIGGFAERVLPKNHHGSCLACGGR